MLGIQENKSTFSKLCLLANLFAFTIVLLCGCKKSETVPTENSDSVIVINDENSNYLRKQDTGSGFNAEDIITASETGSDEENQAVIPGNDEEVYLDPNWKYADYSEINTGSAKIYRAKENRKNIVIGVNAGHGTKGGQSKKTYCHPDKTAKVTGGTTSAGSIKAPAVSGGMTFNDGSCEAEVTLEMALILKKKLIDDGYDVLMLRDGQDVQLDNIARTVIANNTADCLISLHWDGDNLDHDKGCFYISTPEGIRNMEPVSDYWEKHHELGEALIDGLSKQGCKIYQKGSMAIDLTQTSFSCIPSIDLELGNQTSAHDASTLSNLADGIIIGINELYCLE